MLGHCWASVVDGGPTLHQCLLYAKDGTKPRIRARPTSATETWDNGTDFKLYSPLQHFIACVSCRTRGEAGEVIGCFFTWQHIK